MLELGKLLDPVAIGAAVGAAVSATDGLDIVEEEVDKTITAISVELEAIRGNGFAVDGFIAAGSFGQGKEASDLAREHTRAHGVIVQSLTETITDLESFREAIREARRLVRESDEDAQARLQTVLARTESLDLGWNGTDPLPTEDPAPVVDVPATDADTDGEVA